MKATRGPQKANHMCNWATAVGGKGHLFPLTDSVLGSMRGDGKEMVFVSECQL